MLCLQFKRLLNRELLQFAESSKAGTQISEYICSTFLGLYITQLQFSIQLSINTFAS